MKEINKSNLKNPTESGWYLCKFIQSSVLHYNDEENRIGRYDICRCRPRLLYWENNLWLSNPESYNVIEDRDVISWQKLPDEFNIWDEQMKLIY